MDCNEKYAWIESCSGMRNSNSSVQKKFLKIFEIFTCINLLKIYIILIKYYIIFANQRLTMKTN